MTVVLEALTVRKAKYTDPLLDNKPPKREYEIVGGSIKKRMVLESESEPNSFDSMPKLSKITKSESSLEQQDISGKKRSFSWFQPQAEPKTESESEPNTIVKRSNVHKRSFSWFQPQAEPEPEPSTTVKRAVVDEDKSPKNNDMEIGSLIKSNVHKRSFAWFQPQAEPEPEPEHGTTVKRAVVDTEKSQENNAMEIGSPIKSNVHKRSFAWFQPQTEPEPEHSADVKRSVPEEEKATEKMGIEIGSMIKSVVKRSNEQRRITEKLNKLRKRSVVPDPLPGFMDHTEIGEKDRRIRSSGPVLRTNLEKVDDEEMDDTLGSRNRGKRGEETIKFPPPQDPSFMSALVGSVSGPMLDNLAKLMIAAGQARRELRAGEPVKKPTFYATDDLASSDH